MSELKRDLSLTLPRQEFSRPRPDRAKAAGACHRLGKGFGWNLF